MICKPVASFGRLNAKPHKLITLDNPANLSKLICNQHDFGLAHGMGRSYGDVCLNPGGLLWLTTKLNHFISFDEKTGYLRCEAGVLLRDIQRWAIPQGWIVPVTPGTQMVTVGGAIANDVHGKNHHRFGSFGDQVHSITLLRTNGETFECNWDDRPDWFAATIGGLGLTGVIVAATIKLQRVLGPWLNTQTIPYANLTEFFQLADESENHWEHTVSWVDSYRGNGRGLFMRGNFTAIESPSAHYARQFTIPFVPPVSLMNRLSLRALNTTYYHLKKRQQKQSLIHYESFFYPLDSLLEWNRIYGPKGFFQYQCVIPRQNGHEAVKALLKEITQVGAGSFLTVLKTFGDRQPQGMLSFPRSGVTLALDFPNKAAQTHRLFNRLDAIVKAAHGRLYLAKDARMPRELFEAGYPRLAEFLKYRDKGISSELSRRLMGS